MSVLTKLVKGPPGHPLHPPLTDATIGIYTLAAGLAVIGYAGGIEEAAGKAMWLALIGGLITTSLTALTGLVDWLSITWGTPLWRTATAHMIVMVTATMLFALAAWLQRSGYQWSGYQVGTATTGGFVLTIVGFVALTLGGWLGGTVVYVHGMRVLNLVDEPAAQAATPGGERKEEVAA